MKKIFLYVLLVVPLFVYAQNIQVDSQSFTPQQLIEDILIDSNCIENVVVTNVVGGDFGGNEQSYGYFDASGTTFPFEEGIVLSTGRLQNVEGPNTSLSDDDAPGWLGDTDLEQILDEPNTTNATILEFDFTSSASAVSFRYIFASEEYQEGDPNTCQFSDLFGFLIRPLGTQQYENIALVPGTQTPVKVTTVHPEIPGGCPAQNEFYFESFNGANVPINFNGQTTVIEATAMIMPDVTYQVKLVIADEQNFRFDSAVFLEAGSFELSTDIGPNRLISTGNALCENETLILDATEVTASSYVWFKDGVLLPTETSEILLVDEPGTYEVTVTLQNGCESFGEAIIEFSDNPVVFDASLQQCDIDQDGAVVFNLFAASNTITNDDDFLVIVDFFESETQAILNDMPIDSPSEYGISNTNQTAVYARVENDAGCFSIAEVLLSIDTSITQLIIDTVQACDDTPIDGFTNFNLNEITDVLSSQLPADAVVRYYETIEDAIEENNSLSSPYTNTIQDFQNIVVRVTSMSDCFAITTVPLEVLSAPVLEEDSRQFYCLNNFPSTITIQSGVQANPNVFTYSWEFNGMLLTDTTPTLSINEPGTYRVTVTAFNGCSSVRTITVVPSNTATITSIEVTDGTQNNTIAVEVSGEGTYEYALDSILGPYMETPLFTNVSSGFHIVYVRDRNGCGIVQEEAAVIGFPRFFSPNGDAINDTWRVEGVAPTVNPIVQFVIFDRFGKTLFSQRGMGIGWDGVYQGNVLPSNDYWYLVTFADGRTFRGHFSLIKRGI